MFTHIDQKNLPTMVDVTDKKETVRMAEAQTRMKLPEIFRPYFVGNDIILKKGPVFQTAIIAGTMAVKKTHELIPFCHQIPIESCKINILMEDLEIVITCRVKTSFKTGVEMEALHGSLAAALTVYDMCKALSHEIVIGETKLVAKTGGKKTILDRPTYGLVLTGGKSQRMGSDKALINYFGKPHAQLIHDTLAPFCEKVFLSAKKDQWKETSLESFPTIIDEMTDAGPIGGMLSAFEMYPDVNWIVVACDLIHFNEKTVQKLLSHVNLEAIATCFRNREKGFPEPLCAFYTPHALNVFRDAFQSEVRCPVKVLKNSRVELLDQEDGISLANINTKEEFHAFR